MRKHPGRVIASIIAAPFLVLISGSIAIALAGLHDNLQPADVGIVMGCKVNRDGAPSEGLRARLDRAAALYHKGYFKIMLVSGGHGREGYDEPAVMRSYLEARGVPDDVIFEDNSGRNTWATAQNTASFMAEHDLKSALVISEYFHLPRCQLAFSKFGIDPLYTSHARFWSIGNVYSVPREAVGYVAYYLRRPSRNVPVRPPLVTTVRLRNFTSRHLTFLI